MDGGGDDIRFGPFRLSRRKRQLSADSGPVALGTRAFDLLVTLLDRPGRLISKNELLDLVWPGLAVEENNLHVQMVALRRALGAHHDLVQTVPGRGYRFIGDFAGPDAAVPEPPPAPAPAPESGLPAELGRLIGREQELATLRNMLEASRLVTITGPGGIGKTRLAIALAHAVLGSFPGGARLIDLAPLADDSFVEGATAAALGLRPPEAASTVESIAAALKDQPTLLLFDNCEHLLNGAARLVEALLKRCAGISVIATSQEPLKLPAETIYRLDPLALPPREPTREPPGPAPDMLRFGAVALFVRRVEAADRRFRLTADNSAAIVEICHRLDGIPLALEMAAARVPGLGITGLSARLGERLRLLSSGVRTAEARHRTLRDTVGWSFELLDEPDQVVFRRLGVFAGGFSAAAAAEVLAGPRSDETDSWAIFDALGRLIDKSLVVAEPGEPPRYRLLETLRLFALEKLAAAGEVPVFTQAHAEFYDRFFAAAHEAWEATDDAAWLAGTAPELDNMRAALDWAQAAPGQQTLAVSIAGSAARLWDKLSLLAEGRRYLDRAEGLITAETPPAIAGRLHRQIGNLWHSSDRARALAALERAEAIYRALDDPGNLGAVLALIGLVRGFRGAAAAAERALREARLLLESAGRPKSLLNVMNNLGVLSAMNGDMAAARDLFEQALLITRRSGAREGEVLALINLAEIEFNLGQIDAAVRRTGEAVAYLRATGQQADLGWALVNLATYLLRAGRLGEAGAVAREALRLVRPVGGFILRVCLQQSALLAAGAGHLAEAALLAGFVDAGYRSAGEPREATEQRVYDELQGKLADLPAPELERLATEGAAWSEDQAAALAARLLEQIQPS
jgi:predicted ATPase/DNA-binding winged helix-turn-helix (wHTH) protein